MLSLFSKDNEGTGGVAPVVEYLPSKREAPSLNSSATTHTHTMNFLNWLRISLGGNSVKLDRVATWEAGELYSRSPLATADAFQDAQWMPENAWIVLKLVFLSALQHC
jgi:hypothetical protein